jgi:uncharacterized RDD family membrane protein YckC
VTVVVAASPPVPAPAVPKRRAGIVSRLAANGIDFVIVELLFVLVLLGIGMARFLFTDNPFELPRPPVGVTGVVEFAMLTGYLAWGWAASGRTPGKVLVGLRVVTVGGRPLGLGRATARAALCAVFPFLMLGWAVVSRRNAGIHDLLLSTAVVYDAGSRRAG